MSKTLFRWIIIAAAIIYAALIAIPMFDTFLLSEKELDVLSYIGFGAILYLPGSLLWLFVVLWYISMIGTILFFNWGRLLFAFWLMASSVTIALGGLEIRTASEAFLLNLGNILDGVIISIAFFSNLKDEFSR